MLVVGSATAASGTNAQPMLQCNGQLSSTLLSFVLVAASEVAIRIAIIGIYTDGLRSRSCRSPPQARLFA